MQIRFVLPDLDNPRNRALDEFITREVDLVPRNGERVSICPEGEDASRDFVVLNVFHFPDLNTANIILGIPAWEQGRRKETP